MQNFAWKNIFHYAETLGSIHLLSLPNGNQNDYWKQKPGFGFRSNQRSKMVNAVCAKDFEHTSGILGEMMNVPN